MDAPQEINWTQTIEWLDGSTALDARCPACGELGPKPVTLNVRSPWPPNLPQPQVMCPACGSAFNPTMGQPPYEAVLDPLVECYLEQNAGIDVMAEVLAAVDPAQVSRYLDLGCGFGFVLDYTRTVYGWTGKGFDPGFSARAGREVLGVDIEHVYITKPADAGPDPYDLILASEVIEHIFEPDPLLKVLREILTPNGTLLLTTPSSTAIRPETQVGTLLSLLCPGYHFVLYSPKGLEAVLRRVGFKHVIVSDLGHTLRAAASMGPIQADFNRSLDRQAYVGYLRGRASSTDPATPIGMGFRYRLLKECVNLGDYNGAREAAQRVFESCKLGWGIYINKPSELIQLLTAAPLPKGVDDYHKSAPFCLGNILYFCGILAWQGDGDRKTAHQWFKAAALAGERMRAALHVIGADDEETEELTWRARIYAAHVLVWEHPEEAADAIEILQTTPSHILKETVPHRLLLPMRARIFIDLVNLNHPVAADRLAAFVEEALPEDLPTRATLEYALGILTLNYRKAPLTAMRWFEAAYHDSLAMIRETPDLVGEILWSSLYHQAYALNIAGRREEADKIARLLLDHPEAAQMPPLSPALRSRAMALLSPRVQR